MGSPLANLMELVLIVGGGVAFVAWAYAARHFLPMWAVGFRKKPQHRGHWRRTLIGAVTFLAAFGAVAGAMLVAERWG
ncbi:hypothetical protein [Brevundimonas sp.]|uniref:hypothetical protein n=1 Tax=Brevundimonas sp. TaxID=1871086 RepID=UPI0035B0B4AE